MKKQLTSHIFNKFIKYQKSLFRIFWAIFFLIFFLVSFFLSYSLIDPDFGFQLKMGEIMNRSPYFSPDPFTYTMPSYQYHSHEWLSELLLYRLYHRINFSGLAFIFTSLTVISVLILIPKKLYKFALLPLFLSLGVMETHFGVRLQVVSWLLMAVLIKILVSEKKINKKYEIIAPLFFMIWANLHGSFILGLLIYAITVFINNLKAKKISVGSWAILLISIIATLVNPYGFGLWREIMATVLDFRLHYINIEWRPLIIALDFRMIPVMALAIFIFFIYFKAFLLTEKSIYLFLWLITLSSARNIVFFLLMSNYIITKGLSYIYTHEVKNKIARKRFKIFYCGALLYAIIIFLAISYKVYISSISYQEKNFYPQKAITYINNQYCNKRIFTVFQWGGYMIWKMPGYKGFIDGRMPSWKNARPLLGESNNAASEYMDIIEGKDNYQKLLDKYNIELLLLPINEQNLISKLNLSIWKKVYDDNVAYVFINTR